MSVHGSLRDFRRMLYLLLHGPSPNGFREQDVASQGAACKVCDQLLASKVPSFISVGRLGSWSVLVSCLAFVRFLLVKHPRLGIGWMAEAEKGWLQAR